MADIQGSGTPRIYRIDVCATCGARVLAKGYACDRHPSADTEIVSVVDVRDLPGAAAGSRMYDWLISVYEAADRA